MRTGHRHLPGREGVRRDRQEQSRRNESGHPRGRRLQPVHTHADEALPRDEPGAVKSPIVFALVRPLAAAASRVSSAWAPSSSCTHCGRRWPSRWTARCRHSCRASTAPSGTGRRPLRDIRPRGDRPRRIEPERRLVLHVAVPRSARGPGLPAPTVDVVIDGARVAPKRVHPDYQELAFRIPRRNAPAPASA
jgi:hypothetical protein